MTVVGCFDLIHTIELEQGGKKIKRLFVPGPFRPNVRDRFVCNRNGYSLLIYTQ